MTTVTLDSSDPRSLRALELAACSKDWTRLRTDNGEVAYGIPSQQVAGQVYAVTPTSCDCADARRGLPVACEHHSTCVSTRSLSRRRRCAADEDDGGYGEKHHGSR